MVLLPLYNSLQKNLYLPLQLNNFMKGFGKMKTRFLKLMDYIPLISNRTKIEISISLVILAYISYIVHLETLDSAFCFIAMIFSFAGDVSLNGMPLEKRPNWLMYIGAAAFMVAHLVYAQAYYTLIKDSFKFFNLGIIISSTFMVLFLLIAIICVIKSKYSLNISMIIIFGIYAFIIGINFITICSYSWSAKSLSFVGALSFLISDAIIGIETVFKIKSSILRKLVWIFYPIGQFLIITCR